MFVKNFHSLKYLRIVFKSRKYRPSKDKVKTIYLAKQNHSIAIISALLDVSRSSVKKWVKQYNENSLATFLPKKRKPRKLKFPQKFSEKFIQRVCNGPTNNDKVKAFTLLDIQIILEKEYRINYSTSAVSNLLKIFKISYTKPRPLHPKTDKDLQRKWVQKDLPFF